MLVARKRQKRENSQPWKYPNYMKIFVIIMSIRMLSRLNHFYHHPITDLFLLNFFLYFTGRWYTRKIYTRSAKGTRKKMSIFFNYDGYTFLFNYELPFSSPTRDENKWNTWVYEEKARIEGNMAEWDSTLE